MAFPRPTTEEELRQWVIHELDHIIAEIPNQPIGTISTSSGLIARSLATRLRDVVGAYPDVIMHGPLPDPKGS